MTYCVAGLRKSAVDECLDGKPLDGTIVVITETVIVAWEEIT